MMAVVRRGSNNWTSLTATSHRNEDFPMSSLWKPTDCSTVSLGSDSSQEASGNLRRG